MRYRPAYRPAPRPAPPAPRHEVLVRPAHPGDLVALDVLVQQAIETHAARAYSARQRAALAAGPLRTDPRLVDDGTLWVADHAGRIVASAGWTLRADDAAHREIVRRSGSRNPAFLRSLMVHPRHAGGGWARRLVAIVEEQAVGSAGACAMLAFCPINAALFCAHIGYRVLHGLNHSVDGIDLPGLAMGKRLEAGQATRAA